MLQGNFINIKKTHIKIMKNFKITNLKSKVIYLFNENEKVQFFKMNAYQEKGVIKYDIIDLKRIEKDKKIKLYNNILFTLGAFIVFYISIFAILFIFSKIDTFIFSL